MNTTTNYGLKLYEGTDLFNPLTVENVNTGDIDTEMKAISDHSVGTATELTTGTVHALTVQAVHDAVLTVVVVDLVAPALIVNHAEI